MWHTTSDSTYVDQEKSKQLYKSVLRTRLKDVYQNMGTQRREEIRFCFISGMHFRHPQFLLNATITK